MMTGGYDRPRRRGISCSGCLAILVLMVAVVAAAAFLGARMGIPVLQVAHKVGERSFERITETIASDSGVDGELSSTEGYESGSASVDEPLGVGHAESLLSTAQRDAYHQLLEGISNLEETIVVVGVGSDDIDPSFRAVMRDHPELFWLDGSCTYSYTSFGGFVTVKPGLLIPTDQVPATKAEVERVADAFFASLPAGADQYTIARAAYEYVITETDYDTLSSHNQSIISVFLNHSSVCAGYARAYQYLLHRANMFCAYVEGSISETGEDHAWCLARINGAYTYVDPTWGDPTYAGEGSELMQGSIIYDYLCLTTAELTRDGHIFANDAEWPLCDAVELDYYRRSGLMFDGYDEVILSGVFWSQVEGGKNQAAFKFSNAEAYLAARNALSAGLFLRNDLLILAQSQVLGELRYGYTSSDGLYIIKIFW